MNYKPIILVSGEPKSIFLEIFFKTILKKKFKSPIILIASKRLVLHQMKKLNFKFSINNINLNNINNFKLFTNKINLINVELENFTLSNKISKLSNKYIKKSFDIALNLIKKKISNKLINGPISKKTFLNKKFLGITEYLVQKTKSKQYAMLIYNKKLSVSPITTHLPLRNVCKNINQNDIEKKIILIRDFYKKTFNKNISIAVTGLNPHCESINSFNEDEKIIMPVIQNLKKKGLKISGPFSADTIFLKQNRKKYNLIVGMYHDQVLTPIKTLYEYSAINVTLGLPFIRVSPDHGPNEKMFGKNISNPLSLIKSLEFLDI